MKAAHIRDLRQQQMKRETIGAKEQSEMNHRENMKMGYYKQDIERKSIIQKEEIKKHR